MQTFLQDVRLALRTLYRTPGFAVTALAALALGIGANTAIFSVVNQVLLKPLAYPEPDRLVQLMLTRSQASWVGASATKFEIWREQTGIFEEVAAYDEGGPALNVTGGPHPEQIQGMHVSLSYFRLFGTPMMAGRTFTQEEDRPGGGHVLLLTYGFWQRRFGGDPRVIGQTLDLSGQPYTIAGVLGPGFHTDEGRPPDVLLPFQLDPNSTDQAHYFAVAARLRPGVTLDRANVQLQAAVDQFRRKFPGIMGLRDGFAVQPLRDRIVGEVRSSLLILAGAVIFVLLIACANVANLLLARATGRRREIAIRAAVGAGRARIVRQLLTESLVLSVAGGALGLILGLAGVRALLAINPADLPRIGVNGSAIGMDWQVLAFTLLVSVLTGIVFGLIPALGASRADLSSMLKESSSRSGTGLRQNRARSLLVVSEMALAVVLLVGAGLLVRSFVALRLVHPGIDPHRVLTMDMSLTGSRFNHTAAMSRLVRNAVERLQTIPGVVAAGCSTALPLAGHSGLPFNIVGRPFTEGPAIGIRVGWVSVSPAFCEIFRIPLLRGRTFREGDEAGAEPVVLINQTMARRFWPNGDPLVDHIVIGKGFGPEFADPPRRVIGIVGDVRDEGLNFDPEPMLYVPVAQMPDGIAELLSRIHPLNWIVRTREEPHALGSAMESRLREVSGGLPTGRLLPMDEVVARSTARADFNMLLLTIFGCAALLLAAIGIYGLMAYAVQQRTQEFGIRMALGAEPAQVRNMMVWQGMRLALAGITIGIVAAFGLTRLIVHLLFRVRAWDPLVFLSVPALLAIVALIAVWLPSLRATHIHPVEALHYE